MISETARKFFRIISRTKLTKDYLIAALSDVMLLYLHPLEVDYNMPYTIDLNVSLLK